MLKPIQREHESCCPNCGCVLDIPQESNDYIEKPPLKTSFNLLMLGSAMEKNIKSMSWKSSQQSYEENILRILYSITTKYGLPERFVIESHHELKRKKSGFRSENDAIKILIKILSKDENYIHNKQLRLIKARYEKVPGN